MKERERIPDTRGRTPDPRSEFLTTKYEYPTHKNEKAGSRTHAELPWVRAENPTEGPRTTARRAPSTIHAI